MTRNVRILVLVLGLVAAGLVALAVALPLLIDPNQYKIPIERYVARQTGRELVIRGDLTVTVFPHLAIRARDVTLSASPGMDAKSLATARSAEARLAWWPLLKKQVDVDDVVLDGLRVNLITDRQGRRSWLGKTTKSGDEPAAGAVLAAVAVRGLRVHDGHVVWDDRPAGRTWVLDRLDLTVDRIAAGRPSALALSVDLEGSGFTQPVPVKISGVLTPDQDVRHLKLDDFSLRTEKDGFPIRVSIGRMNGALEARTLSVRDIHGSISGLPIAATVDAPRLELDFAHQTLSLPKLSLEAGEARLDGTFEGKQLLTAPRVTGTVDATPFDLRRLLQNLGAEPHTADPRAYGRFGLHARVALTRAGLALTGIDGKLDDTRFLGTANLRWGRGSASGFDLALDQLDLDRYRAPAGRKSAGGATAAGPAALAALATDGKLRIGKLKALGISARDVDATWESRRGEMRLAPLRARLYQGELTGSLTLGNRGGVPAVAVQGGLKQVQLGPLLADAAISRKLTGVGTVNLDLTARGGDRQQLLRTLNGTVNMSLRDGLIKGLDLQKLILQAKQLEARYRGKEIPVAPQAGDEFRFTELNASARITDGVARNDDLSVKSPYFRIAGRGTADLPANRVDYQLDVTLVDTPKGQGGEELTALKGATIPVRVDGPLDQPRYRVALGALLQRELEKALLRELQKRLQK